MTADFAERAPRQARSRESWERVLRTALELFEGGGWEALSISETCRRAGVSAPSIYARVDGRAGLFAAVYEFGIQRMRTTEDQLFETVSDATPESDPATRVVRIITQLFAEHAPFLRAVISRSVDDPALLDMGAAESRRLVHRLGEELGAPAGVEAARVLYSECVLRTMYGDSFLVDGESFEVYQTRLCRIARSILAAAE
ncbi:TetR/AcrR family transcriptional regulator [Leifsonia sp. 2TAF2]|uniref:TetR/AcrR family transcriptional regulator n=1 Tax=Leifsonia sp. 2TAF2 TaxID=3233009 RepID=UPI003F9526A2